MRHWKVWAWCVLTSTAGLGQCVPPFAENFDAPGLAGLPAGWTQAAQPPFTWTLQTGPTPSQLTGPPGDSGTGFGSYLYTEATGANTGATAVLTLPCVDLTGVFNPHLQFDMHMDGLGMGSLSVETETSPGVWLEVFSRQGAQGESWRRASVPLPPRSDGTARVRFVAIRGNDFTSDIAIDAIRIGRGIPPLWQENRLASRLNFDGVLVPSPDGPKAERIVPLSTLVTVQAASTGSGQGYDVFMALAGSVLASQGGLSTIGLQNLHLPINHPTFGSLFTGALSVQFQPWPGDFSLQLGSALPTFFSAQMIVTAPTEPEGFALSQACEAEWTSDLCRAAQDLQLGDDTAATLVLGFAMTFYGGATDRVFIGSNGIITLSGARTLWPMNAQQFFIDVPTIAILAADLDPSAAGSVHAATDRRNTFCVEWRGVPSFGLNNQNSMSVTYRQGLEIVFDYRGGIDETRGLVGLSPGAGRGLFLPVDFSFRPITVGSLDIVYEDFSLLPNDLTSEILTFRLTNNGTPFRVD